MKTITSNFNPKSLDDIAGQSHLIGKDKIIRKMVETKNMFSIIFFGLPGIGKTSLAKAICNEMKLEFYFFNPTINKKQELETIIRKSSDKKPIVIIIDEIHRMNRDKQDILLYYLEKNYIYIIGTTTENPYFVVNPAIRSRTQIFELLPLKNVEMFNYINKICKEKNLIIEKSKIELIINNSLGDLRAALNGLEIYCKLYGNNNISNEDFLTLLPSCRVVGSSYGNEFYNLQSAFHKSLRGSDIDASLYYLARLIKIGDLQSIFRRMIAMAYEDIGLANPNLLSRVILAVQSAERLGLPEANQILSATVIELCLSPKSNSAYKAISHALLDLEENSTISYDIPKHLKDTHYKSSKKLGYGSYKNPHDYSNNWVEQEYMPKELKDKKYYRPGNNEIELKMNKILKDRKNEK